MQPRYPRGDETLQLLNGLLVTRTVKCKPLQTVRYFQLSWQCSDEKKRPKQLYGNKSMNMGLCIACGADGGDTGDCSLTYSTCHVSCR